MVKIYFICKLWVGNFTFYPIFLQPHFHFQPPQFVFKLTSIFFSGSFSSRSDMSRTSQHFLFSREEANSFNNFGECFERALRNPTKRPIVQIIRGFWTAMNKSYGDLSLHLQLKVESFSGSNSGMNSCTILLKQQCFLSAFVLTFGHTAVFNFSR